MIAYVPGPDAHPGPVDIKSRCYIPILQPVLFLKGADGSRTRKGVFNGS